MSLVFSLSIMRHSVSPFIGFADFCYNMFGLFPSPSLFIIFQSQLGVVIWLVIQIVIQSRHHHLAKDKWASCVHNGNKLRMLQSRQMQGRHLFLRSSPSSADFRSGAGVASPVQPRPPRHGPSPSRCAALLCRFWPPVATLALISPWWMCGTRSHLPELQGRPGKKNDRIARHQREKSREEEVTRRAETMAEDGPRTCAQFST